MVHGTAGSSPCVHLPRFHFWIPIFDPNPFIGFINLLSLGFFGGVQVNPRNPFEHKAGSCRFGVSCHPLQQGLQ